MSHLLQHFFFYFNNTVPKYRKRTSFRNLFVRDVSYRLEKLLYRIGAFRRVSVDAIASDGLQDDLITIAIDKENSLADDKA